MSLILDPCSSPSLLSCQSRLSAQYLPSLIQLSLEVMNSSKFSASFNDTAQLWIRGPSWLADAINYGCEQVSRFVRLHPEESSKIFKAFARWTDAASSLPEDAFVKVSLRILLPKSHLSDGSLRPAALPTDAPS